MVPSLCFAGFFSASLLDGCLMTSVAAALYELEELLSLNFSDSLFCKKFVIKL